jgi:hypothetical protein
MPEIFLVECITQHRIVYAVEAESQEYAADIVTMESGDSTNFKELGQQWLGEVIVSARPVDEATYLQEFDLINDHLKDWPTEKKLSFINTEKVEEPARESHHRELP